MGTATAADGEEETFKFDADMVLVTVSLGVLKSKMVTFNPPLPMWKTASIGRLGFGLINKLVLEWKEEDVFWRDVDMFGHIKDSPENRGNNYMYWNLKKVTGKPILVSIFSGKAAHKLESTPKEDLVKEAMEQLRRIYGEQIPDPIRTLKTGWKGDPLARGTYSYVKVGASGSDYDKLARPVKDRLFFAGEATCRLYPATVPGAHASGLFAAGQIADAANPVKHELFKANEAIMSRFKAGGSGKRFRKGFRDAREVMRRSNSWFSPSDAKYGGGVGGGIMSSSEKDRSLRKIKLESSFQDLMDGKIGILEVDSKGQSGMPFFMEDTVSSPPLDLKKMVGGVEEEDDLEAKKRKQLPTVSPDFDEPEYQDDDIIDMTDTLLSKSHRKRRKQEQSRDRLRDKIQRKMQKNKRKKKERKNDGSLRTSGLVPDSYIRNYIKKLLAKYAAHHKLSDEQQGQILDKAYTKVLKDWESKDRKDLAVKKWMGNEKRKKSLKALVSKYSKRYAKKK
uniref:Amine oxidase domain-containing protein n=2 Tax=Lotharella globosa TaxID=91324 RepID=A0A7S4DHT5_9EUKA|mmetsp:Transcript_30887/g.59551  ORF Transcript_30887/g.59551 Transcript_30887/m.59551 type:complete len:507 (+) Transcript_30887:411-1931(+)